MHKYRLMINPYAIEKWVNDMACQGWHLKKFIWIRFTFERGEPGRYIYRHDELERFGSHYEEDYLEFLQSSGIEQVDRSGNFVFFRKVAQEGPFELYTDKKTKIGNLSKKMTLLFSLILLNLFIGIIGLMGDFSEQTTDWVGFTLNTLNLVVVVLFSLPLYKLMRVRNRLKRELNVFSD
ncbi:MULTISPECIES: DUF2812 domain-containing protein [Lysinibacillus]|uniref:DUF2812 domain-containing protein n=1 Tax=Lysinibacillus fusiformis TaxID=28031 RepID=A0A2I0UYA6_9BACI|nr:MULTISPECIES: DUF2812 domain-containing protein [Lysinibacillus]MEE3808654.1 DUF2812 domain-containing protein [Lysinibacillus fusiformis]PKU51051.1 DUF2812 domain-containing protein [Lysinibacillus fusiformis]SCY20003.1 Protein of unknown function [Lysinibacillus sp. SG9]SDB10240.1 Protein of unknown function [Lysinibacillus sp. TC-37]SFS46416.1 Protein of unknown function [Lysinibacillus sp. SG55]